MPTSPFTSQLALSALGLGSLLGEWEDGEGGEEEEEEWGREALAPPVSTAGSSLVKLNTASSRTDADATTATALLCP